MPGTFLSIGWFLGCVELTDDSHVEISVQVQDSEMTGIRSIKSRLTISTITDEYAGEYTCNLLGDDEYIPSDIFTLHDSKDYEIFRPLGPCHDSGDVFANAQAAPQKCAIIKENRTIPMSLGCAEPLATTSHDTPVTSTLVVYTSSPLSTSSLTPSTSSHPHSLTSSPTITMVFTTTIQKDSQTSLPGDLNSTSQYLAAVCAVLIMIIIILIMTFVLAKTCRRQSSLIAVNEQNSKCESKTMINQLCTLYNYFSLLYRPSNRLLYT